MPLKESEIEGVIQALAKDESGAICVSAPTGSGKSTLIPAYIAKKDPDAVVFCVQPTIAAVRNLYSWVKKSNKDISVGYAAESEAHYTSIRDAKRYGKKPTQIVFCTAGHCKKVILGSNKGDMNFCHVLMVDEVHNPAMDIDIIVNVWYEHSQREEELKRPYLLMASATAVLSTVPFDPTFMQLGEATHEVDVKYHSQNYPPNNSKIYSDLAKIINTKAITTPKHKWLVFCPGVSEMGKLESMLDKKLKVFKLHGKSLPKELDVITEAPTGIILSTNVAETSVTIPGINGVFDTMLEKVVVSRDTTTNLITSHVSKASADQRKGRTGRTSKGFCYRMCTALAYDGFDDNRSPDLERLNIDDAYLSLTCGGVDIQQLYSDRLGEEKLDASKDRLEEKKLIQEKIATKKGHYVNNIPLGINQSIFLYEWEKKGYPIYPGVVAASILDVGLSLIWYSKDDDKDRVFNWVRLPENRKGREMRRSDTKSIFEVYLHEWEAMTRAIKSVKVTYKNEKKLLEVCSTRHLNYQECRRIFTKVRSILDKKEGYELAKIEPGDILSKMDSILGKSFFETLHGDDGMYYKQGSSRKQKISNRQHFHPEDVEAEGLYVIGRSADFVTYYFPIGVY